MEKAGHEIWPLLLLGYAAFTNVISSLGFLIGKMEIVVDVQDFL